MQIQEHGSSEKSLGFPIFIASLKCASSPLSVIPLPIKCWQHILHLVVLTMESARPARGDFQYHSLSSPRSIRLLHLHRDLLSEDETITGSLEEVNLDTCSTYDAISYTWGDPTPEAVIQCNGRTLLITRNCNEALRRLMRDKLGRTVWVDEICINQDSMEERAHQVELMGTVYRNASKVLVWLGPGTDGSDMAMSMLRRLYLAKLVGQQRRAVEELYSKFSMCTGRL